MTLSQIPTKIRNWGKVCLIRLKILVMALDEFWNSSSNDSVFKGLSWPWLYGSWIYNYLCNQCLSTLMLWVRMSIRVRWTTLCDKVCQWLATGRWFSLDPPVSTTNKTDRHEITEILLKVVLNTITLTPPPSNPQSLWLTAYF
jgi:hypothetical protein